MDLAVRVVIICTSSTNEAHLLISGDALKNTSSFKYEESNCFSARTKISGLELFYLCILENDIVNEFLRLRIEF